MGQRARELSEAALRPEATLRQELVDSARQMNALGINQGTSGNLSARLGSAGFGETMLITPSATPYDAMRADQVAAIPLADDAGSWVGPLKPSTEWRFHQAILRARPEVGAVVHTHAPHCTALAMARREIPACHYMVALFGGASVRCAPYAPFGTAELAALALTALQGRTACLLANHGMIVTGRSLSHALWLAVELETLARQYCLSLQLGGPVLLSEAEIAQTLRSFSGYGVSG